MGSIPQELFFIRDKRTEDLAHILSTWLKGAYYGNNTFRKMRQDDFFEFYQPVIKEILFSPLTVTRVAALKEDPDIILSYVVYTPKVDGDILHWVYTKNPWRKSGLAKALIPNTVKSVTHLTKLGQTLKPKEWKYDGPSPR